jgi:nicotinic acid mononucleotide adenylyltransferase
MASHKARLASARKMARRAPIRATAIEAQMGTRYTIDTLRKLVRRYPNRRFIWIMGADNVANFTRWRRWRDIARLMPIAVIARPGYDDACCCGPRNGLAQAVRPASGPAAYIGRCGAHRRLYSCAFAPIHVRPRRFARPTLFGIATMKASASSTASPTMFCM